MNATRSDITVVGVDGAAWSRIMAGTALAGSFALICWIVAGSALMRVSF